jgi:hypothetical protein
MAFDAAKRDARRSESPVEPELSGPSGVGERPATELPGADRPAALPVRRVGRDPPSLGLAALRVGPALMLLAVVAAAAAALSPVFFTTLNLGNVLSQTAVIAILALAQLLVIVTRGAVINAGRLNGGSPTFGALAERVSSSRTASAKAWTWMPRRPDRQRHHGRFHEGLTCESPGFDC